MEFQMIPCGGLWLVHLSPSQKPIQHPINILMRSQSSYHPLRLNYLSPIQVATPTPMSTGHHCLCLIIYTNYATCHLYRLPCFIYMDQPHVPHMTYHVSTWGIPTFDLYSSILHIVAKLQNAITFSFSSNCSTWIYLISKWGS